MLEATIYQVGSQGMAGAKWRLLETQVSLLVIGTGFPGRSLQSRGAGTGAVIELLLL